MNNLPTRKFSINLRAENIDLEKAIQHCLDSSVQQYLYLNKVAEIFIHKSKGGFEDHVDITQHFIKQPDYTLDNLPKNGWYVELPFDQNKIDLDKLEKSFGTDYAFYDSCGLKCNKYFYFNSMGLDDCTDNFDVIGHLENATHLFLKQDQKMEIIEIDGKKYRKIDTGGEFENGDLFIFETGEIVKFIGYDNEAIVYADNSNYYHTIGEKVFKLEEIKVWHYAITENEFGLCHTIFYSSEDELKRAYPNALEYRTFERECDPEL